MPSIRLSTAIGLMAALFTSPACAEIGFTIEAGYVVQNDQSATTLELETEIDIGERDSISVIYGQAQNHADFQNVTVIGLDYNLNYAPGYRVSPFVELAKANGLGTAYGLGVQTYVDVTSFAVETTVGLSQSPDGDFTNHALNYDVLVFARLAEQTKLKAGIGGSTILSGPASNAYSVSLGFEVPIIDGFSASIDATKPLGGGTGGADPLIALGIKAQF